MPSEIEDQLTRKEKIVLEIYRNPKKHGIKSMIRLSVQYGVGTAIFTGLALFQKEPLYVLPVFFTFLAFLILRIKGALAIKNIMPGIIEKYEKALRDLKNRSKKPKILDFGFEFDFKKIWDLYLPIEEMKLEDLSNNLDIPYLEKEGTDDWNLTPRALIQNPENEPSHYARVKEADLKYPIALYFHERQWKILDGVHRYCKAHLNGDTTIKVKKISNALIPQIRSGI